MITNKNIGSQSVNYANTSGSATNEYSVVVSSSTPTDGRTRLWIQP